MSLSLAILVSGRGSNMSAILDAIKSGALDATVSVVFSNNPEAKALEIAAAHGISIESLSHKGMSREEHEKSVLQILSKYKIDFVVLAGYMRVLSPCFLRAFKGTAAHLDEAANGASPGEQLRRPDGPPCTPAPLTFDPAELYRIINIHPSLLPSFPGAHAYEDAWEAGVPASGITIHLVDELVDHGPILHQDSFQRLAGDNIDTFKARGLALEHKLFPAVLHEISKKGIIPVLQEFAGSSSQTESYLHTASGSETASQRQLDKEVPVK